MHSLSNEEVERFCALCNWAWQCWITHKTLFEDNTKKHETIEKAPYFHERIWHITQEYSVLQICKLHDREKLGRDFNLSIDYVVESFKKDEEYKTLVELRDKLDSFYKYLQPARHKLIAHYDRDAQLMGKTLGEFPENADVEYFANLKTLAKRVHEKTTDGPFLFDAFAISDAMEYLALLEKIDLNGRRYEF